MSRLGRATRRADEWASPHERARTRAAQRLDWPLDPDEAAWLDGHLAGCTSCSALAADYVEIRNRLRALRTVTPPPPRDLWARTAAAIERESRHRRRAPTRRVPVGALSGVLVIAVVLGATLLSNLPRRGVVTPEGSVSTAAESLRVIETSTAVGTPIVVGAGDVQVVRRDPDGSYGFTRVGVDEVCPADGAVHCPMARDDYATAVAFPEEPETIIGSPDEDSAVVVGTADGTKANNVIVMSLPKDQPEPTPSEPPASAPPSATSDPEPSATASTSSDPAATIAPSASPAVSAAPSATPEVSDEPSNEPSPEPVSPTPSAMPSGEPSPTPEAIAIASDLIVVGQTAAFSPDGEWFAFTGRPADETTGPDIYVWHVGDQLARPVTSDHRSVFASWSDGRLVGSRAAAVAGDGVEVAPEAFLVDPETGSEQALADDGWRPVVAPGGARALVFNGSVAGSDRGRQLDPGTGSFELRSWDQATGADPDSATVILEASGSHFDARWDESGTAFAVWVEDPVDPSFGRLSLYFVDPETGAVEQPENAPRDEPALPGFSIGKDRLAWATPAGQGGEGSRVLIVAWTEDGVGTIETAPGERAVVVR